MDGIVYNQAWFSWLQDIPVNVKIRFKDLQVLYFDMEDRPMPTGLFKQVRFQMACARPVNKC